MKHYGEIRVCKLNNEDIDTVESYVVSSVEKAKEIFNGFKRATANKFDKNAYNVELVCDDDIIDDFQTSETQIQHIVTWIQLRNAFRDSELNKG